MENAVQGRYVSFDKVCEKLGLEHLDGVYLCYGYVVGIPETPIRIALLPRGSPEFLVETLEGTITLKPCHRCKKLLPRNAFYQNKSPCKECSKARVVKWAKAHPEKVKRYNANYRKKCTSKSQVNQ